jgi:hypothetical protein
MSCTNKRCEHGWVQVLPSYADTHAPEPELPEGDGPEMDALRAKLIAEWHSRQASLRETWYPCRECNRRMFLRWAGHHLESDHDRTECEICETPRPHSRRRRTEHTNSLAIPEPPPETPEERF